MKSLFFLVLLAIKEQFHIKSLQGSSLHSEASQIANSSDLKKKKFNSPESISRYRLLPIIPGNFLAGVGGSSYSYRQITTHYVLYYKKRKKLSDTEIRGFQNVLMSMFPLSSVLVHFVGRMIHSFQIWQLKQQQI